MNGIQLEGCRKTERCPVGPADNGVQKVITVSFPGSGKHRYGQLLAPAQSSGDASASHWE